VVAVFIKRLVSRPVAQLREGTRRIADGDLETRIQVSGRHELAGLAEAFNQMAEDLSASRREVIEWSKKLEEKVVEKTQELGRTQRQVLHMEKMASLGKLSATVAHELNNPIGGMLTYARLVCRELDTQTLDREVREELTRYLGRIRSGRSQRSCGTQPHARATSFCHQRRAGALQVARRRQPNPCR
jgi:two-component system NtrC family sensor kinase